MHICLKAMKGLLYDAIESAPSEEGYFSFIPSNFHRMFCLKVVRNGLRAVGFTNLASDQDYIQVRGCHMKGAAVAGWLR